MQNKVRRIYSEKKSEFDSEGKSLQHELRHDLGIKDINAVRVLHRYDIQGLAEEAYSLAMNTIFSEPPVDQVYEENLPKDLLDPNGGWVIFAWEYLPGQYDQRSDSAAQAVQLLTHGVKPIIKTATVIAVQGRINGLEWQKIKSYIVNPVDSHETGLEKPITLDEKIEMPQDIVIVGGFTTMNSAELADLNQKLGFAMDQDDIAFCQEYFRDVEKRDPTLTELKIIDTYWSDHCRHTTFLTQIDSVKFEESPYQAVFQDAYNEYKKVRTGLYHGRPDKYECLMDIATLAMKELKRVGKLDDLDESDEINACSIVVPVDEDGKTENWLVQFKNETHNHPTEIEPFGGAATCIGGAIRDPLSGRAYVYQAMRVTGSGDPRTPVEKTMPGKLPQRKITLGAAHGYSSYGNQIGLATGQVSEVYDEGYVAKRMEIGAVIGAVKQENVVRKQPLPGDVVILLGGRTGRDGCGGATGSSKSHTEESILKSGAEVQKGNAPEERKIQRLFRKPEVTKLIKKCNDFGAGGVSVAIGELADGLVINLDLVPKKYEGLDGTELAISESQERMAVVVSPENADAFISAANAENLEATRVATVTEEASVQMFWRNKRIVHLDRAFLNSNGAKKHTSVFVKAPLTEENPFLKINCDSMGIKEAWFEVLSNINSASQKGLGERFDSTIGTGSVVLPFGGKEQLTPVDFMAAKIPLLRANTSTATMMSWGYDPRISRFSPFHGALYAIIESCAKLTAAGGDYRKYRLTLQEYFEKPQKIPSRWGKPFAALLGAFYTQMKLGIPAIGGKDSMSGSFKELDVPPTLVSFAVAIANSAKIITPEFKKAGSAVVYLPLKIDDQSVPDFIYLDHLYRKVHEWINDGKVLSAQSVRGYGIAEAISKMAFGNNIGFSFEQEWPESLLFGPGYGDLILEMNALPEDKEFDIIPLGLTLEAPEIHINDEKIKLSELVELWLKPLDGVFPLLADDPKTPVADYSYQKGTVKKSAYRTPKPKVFITTFPGTNCEYDSARAFEKAGAEAITAVFRNRTLQDIDESVQDFVKGINDSQIIMIPGGFSSGDEPEGSGKFIASVFRNPSIRDAVMELLNKRDGLILGICNGFQALIKIGLVPYGEIREMDQSSPTLTYNTIGRHMSSMIRTKVVSNLSPWFSTMKVGDIHTIAVSHGEGRFIAGLEALEELKKKGQIATQYIDNQDRATNSMPWNPNGSLFAIEGITSPDGRVLGKMAHSERTGEHIAINIPGNKDQKIFEAGVAYFK